MASVSELFTESIDKAKICDTPWAMWGPSYYISGSPVVWTDRKVGWECPRCGQVWSPWVDRCDCKPINGFTYSGG